MPLWQLFVPEGAYSAEDKRDLGNRITDIYSKNFDLPRFYTSVFFHELKPESYLVGGEPRNQFVQVAIVHAARTDVEVAKLMGITIKELEDLFFQFAADALKPYVEDRGYETEWHVEVVARETWKIDGMAPPPPWSPAEKQWANDNKSSPYVLSEQ